MALAYQAIEMSAPRRRSTPRSTRAAGDARLLGRARCSPRSTVDRFGQTSADERLVPRTRGRDHRRGRAAARRTGRPRRARRAAWLADRHRADQLPAAGARGGGPPASDHAGQRRCPGARDGERGGADGVRDGCAGREGRGGCGSGSGGRRRRPGPGADRRACCRGRGREWSGARCRGRGGDRDRHHLSRAATIGLRSDPGQGPWPARDDPDLCDDAACRVRRAQRLGRCG